MNKWLVFCIAILCCISSSLAYPYGQTYDSVLLQDVKALTFTKGQYTAARRSAPIPQLGCVGGSASYATEFFPSTVQCINVGVDSYGNVQWKCEADLDSSVKFGETIVNCEGYSNPDDPYILRGSCGLEYNLDYTPQGMKNKNGASYGGYSYNYNSYPQSNQSFSWGNVFMFVIFGIIILGIINQCSKNAGTANNNYFEGSYPSTTYSSGNGYGTGYQGTWRPGFWGGFGTGGLLGYLFRPRTYYGGPSYGYGYNRPTYNSWGSSGGSWGSSGGFGSSSGPRTASAFASTRKR